MIEKAAQSRLTHGAIELMLDMMWFLVFIGGGVMMEAIAGFS